jgi:hypothetical protein
VASDAVVLAVCDAYWNQVHRRYFVKLESEKARAIAANLTKWARKRLAGHSLAAVVERLQEQGLVLAQILIDTSVRGKAAELVASVQPTQLGLDRAEALRARAKAKR